ncbi:hypothetical protein D3C79_859010 [compost metagenome]
MKSRQSSTRLRSLQWLALMLKPKWNPLGSLSTRGANASRTWAISNRVMGTMRPLSSASGMKRSGEIMPWRGCCQRISTSQPLQCASSPVTTGCR